MSGPDPSRVAVSKSKGLEIDWADGHHSSYGLRYLRDRCPCAACASGPPQLPNPSPFKLYTPALKIASVEPAGNYALRLHWSDGHNTGLYSWDYLRRLCPCGECVK